MSNGRMSFESSHDLVDITAYMVHNLANILLRCGSRVRDVPP